MKIFKRIASGTSAAVLTLSTIMTMGLTGVAHAAGAPDVWSGAASATNGLNGCATNCWSVGGNWVGGVAPIDGQDVTINNPSASASLGVNDDLSLPTVGIISLTGSSDVSVLFANPIKLMSDVTSTTGGSSESTLFGEMTVGGDLTMTNVTLTTETTPHSGDGKTLHLNTHTLTFKDTTSNGTNDISNDISGSGTLAIDVGQNTMFLDGTNTYSGTTNIISSGNIDTLTPGNSAGLFGTSSIIVAGDATLGINAVSSFTFTNPITFQQASQNANIYGNQLIVWNQSATPTAVTVAIPNVTLLGNTRFDVNDTSGAVLVNLAGITANGHCVQYRDAENDGVADFQNGPTACVVSTTATTPKTPNTGLALVSAHPAITAAVAVVASVTLFGLARATRKVAPARVKANKR